MQRPVAHTGFFLDWVDVSLAEQQIKRKKVLTFKIHILHVHQLEFYVDNKH